MDDDPLEALNQRIDKLERAMTDLVTVLKGDEDGISAGLFGRVKRHQDILYGKDDEKFGLIHKVNLMWRGHIWLLCGASGVMGYGLKWAVERLGG